MVGSSLNGMSYSQGAKAVVELRGAVRKSLEGLAAGDRVIAACSGGADSLALSWALSVEADRKSVV